MKNTKIGLECTCIIAFFVWVSNSTIIAPTTGCAMGECILACACGASVLGGDGMGTTTIASLVRIRYLLGITNVSRQVLGLVPSVGSQICAARRHNMSGQVGVMQLIRSPRARAWPC